MTNINDWTDRMKERLDGDLRLMDRFQNNVMEFFDIKEDGSDDDETDN